MAPRVWLGLHDVDQVGRLDEEECHVLEYIHVVREVGQWEAWREDHVYKHHVEASHAEHCVVEKGSERVSVDALVEGLPLALDGRLFETRLVAEHEDCNQNWPSKQDQ